MKQITVLPPDAYSDADLAFLVPRILELLYTGEDLREFARDCGWDGPPFRWDDERRFLLRCELDAAFFHLYLPGGRRTATGARPANPMAAPAMRRQSSSRTSSATSPPPATQSPISWTPSPASVARTRSQPRRIYRTKRTILDIYDAMQASFSTDEPYRTRLAPPPADPSRCHPSREKDHE